ncbi:MAG: S8 family serine peptidase, partial [Nitrososphaerales archaeon]
APGNNCHTTVVGGSIQQKSGTSVAAGFVSGVAALCWSRVYSLNNPDAFPTGAANLAKRDQIYASLLLTTAWNEAGHNMAGRLNAYNAVNNMTA